MDNPTAVEPNTSEFMFDDLSFSSASNGWIVNDKFFLHVTGEQIEVTFTNRLYVHFTTVAAPTREEAWAGGWQGGTSTDEAVLWRYRGGKWEPVNLSPVPVHHRHIWTVRFESPENGWATIVRNDPSTPYAIPAVGLLHFNGATWREIAPLFSSSQPRLMDMCVQAPGTGWAVGDAGDQEGRRQGIALKKEGLEWREITLPALVEGASWKLRRVACLSTGGMIASVEVAGKEKGIIKEGFLLRYDGKWTKIPFPEAYREYSAGALTPVHDDDIWLHASPVENPSVFLHRVGERWFDVSIPPLPGKGPPYRGVAVNAMQFVSPDEGWAVGTKYYGEGYVRGLVFHYKDGTWRTRNWNWHFWNQRWFGLFGE